MKFFHFICNLKSAKSTDCSARFKIKRKITKKESKGVRNPRPRIGIVCY